MHAQLYDFQLTKYFKCMETRNNVKCNALSTSYSALSNRSHKHSNAPYFCFIINSQFFRICYTVKTGRRHDNFYELWNKHLILLTKSFGNMKKRNNYWSSDWWKCKYKDHRPISVNLRNHRIFFVSLGFFGFPVFLFTRFFRLLSSSFTLDFFDFFDFFRLFRLLSFSNIFPLILARFQDFFRLSRHHPFYTISFVSTQQEHAMESSQLDRDMIPTKESSQTNQSKLASAKKRNADMIKVCAINSSFTAHNSFLLLFTLFLLTDGGK